MAGAAIDPLDLTGMVVLVTGGAKGVGRGITEAFLAHGADVMVCGRSEPDSLPTVDGRSAAFHPADVRDVDALYAELKPKLDTLPPGDVHGPADKPYGQRELLVLAPDGELIVFGMELSDGTG